jgi:hypothetical protein
MRRKAAEIRAFSSAEKASKSMPIHARINASKRTLKHARSRR